MPVAGGGLKETWIALTPPALLTDDVTPLCGSEMQIVGVDEYLGEVEPLGDLSHTREEDGRRGRGGGR